MMAAIAAARNGHQVHLYEKNEKLGKKIYITGKGRCNITNASEMETVFENVVTNRKFLYSAFYNLTNDDVINVLSDLDEVFLEKYVNGIEYDKKEIQEKLSIYSRELWFQPW